MALSSLARYAKLLLPLLLFLASSRRVSSAVVEKEQRGTILLISINRPEDDNAVNTETAQELAEAFRQFETDDNSAVAVLYGKGGTFSSGRDLKEVKDPNDFLNSLAPPGEGDGPMGPTRLKLTKPVIGAIEGEAVGAGLELALMCDLRVVDEDSKMGFSNRKSGWPMLDGGAVRLPYIVGLSRALDLIMTGRLVDAQEALDIGLANRVVPTGTALDEAVNLATLIAGFPSEAMKADRKTAYYSAYNADSFYDALTYEYRKGVKIEIIKEAVSG